MCEFHVLITDGDRTVVQHSSIVPESNICGCASFADSFPEKVLPATRDIYDKDGRPCGSVVLDRSNGDSGRSVVLRFSPGKRTLAPPDLPLPALKALVLSVHRWVDVSNHFVWCLGQPPKCEPTEALPSLAVPGFPSVWAAPPRVGLARYLHTLLVGPADPAGTVKLGLFLLCCDSTGPQPQLGCYTKPLAAGPAYHVEVCRTRPAELQFKVLACAGQRQTVFAQGSYDWSAAGQPRIEEEEATWQHVQSYLLYAARTGPLGHLPANVFAPRFCFPQIRPCLLCPLPPVETDGLAAARANAVRLLQSQVCQSPDSWRPRTAWELIHALSNHNFGKFARLGAHSGEMVALEDSQWLKVRPPLLLLPPGGPGDSEQTTLWMRWNTICQVGAESESAVRTYSVQAEVKCGQNLQLQFLLTEEGTEPLVVQESHSQFPALWSIFNNGFLPRMFQPGLHSDPRNPTARQLQVLPPSTFRLFHRQNWARVSGDRDAFFAHLLTMVGPEEVRNLASTSRGLQARLRRSCLSARVLRLMGQLLDLFTRKWSLGRAWDRLGAGRADWRVYLLVQLVHACPKLAAADQLCAQVLLARSRAAAAALVEAARGAMAAVLQTVRGVAQLAWLQQDTLGPGWGPTAGGLTAEQARELEAAVKSFGPLSGDVRYAAWLLLAFSLPRQVFQEQPDLFETHVDFAPGVDPLLKMHTLVSLAEKLVSCAPPGIPVMTHQQAKDVLTDLLIVCGDKVHSSRGTIHTCCNPQKFLPEKLPIALVALQTVHTHYMRTKKVERPSVFKFTLHEKEVSQCLCGGWYARFRLEYWSQRLFACSGSSLSKAFVLSVVAPAQKGQKRNRQEAAEQEGI